MPCIPLHQTWQIYPLQLSIDALNTITPNLADLPPSIEHRGLAYCYTKLEQIYPHQLSICRPSILLHQTWPRSTPISSIFLILFHICNLELRNAEIQRSLDSQYSSLSSLSHHLSSAQLSLSLSVTLLLAPSKQPYICGTPLHQISVTYRTMHIYP